MARNILPQDEIQRMLYESDVENTSVREIDSDTEDIAFDICFESEGNAIKSASENDHEKLWRESDDIPLQEYASSHNYEDKNRTIRKTEPYT
ncbi:hypothetical protein EVAR_33823_1 [Eumeta japonica]|uniref:Uncharacterized protein n=1 Tax=Eumeta variegata TaxID=151549 RepID=A0A4C1VAR0_EUMVA|nr:hypothetical protein EVAR_33823_1 [Eumeta japonica]